MKIKIINKELFEGTPLNQTAPQNVADNAGRNNRPSNYDKFTAIAAKQFIQERKKDSLPIDITVPGDFYNQLNLPAAPQDIAVVMSTIQTNKARKTRDLEKWGMVDPISTYNNAEDCCKKAFDSFFSGPIQLAQSKEEIKANKQDVHNSNESLIYDECKALNESAGTAGILFGQAAGSIASSALSFLGCAGASFAVSIAPVVGAILVSTDLIGKAGEKIFGDVDRNDRNTNDEVAAPLNGAQIAQTTSSMPMDYGDVVQAFDNYIRRMVQETRDLMTGISPNMSKTYTSEFGNFVINCLGVLSEESEKFIADNSKYLQAKKQQEEKNRSERDNKELNKLRSTAEFSNALLSYAMPKHDQELMADAIKAGAWLQSHYNRGDKATFLYEAYQDNGPKGAIEYYRTHIANNDKETDESYKFVNGNILNEDVNDANNGRIQLDLDKYYRTLITELTNRIDTVLDEFDPKNMTNLAETKQIMEDLIKTADETIKNKIQIITKADASAGGQKQTGLGQAALQFLAGHPLEANNLIEVWSRHLGDLKMRMNNRIKIMTDNTNSTRILGWTFNMMRTLLPEFFARMLTYRFAYAVLSNEGVYSYDTAQAERDLQMFNAAGQNGGPSIRDSYLGSARAQIIFLLSNFSEDYTDGGNIVDIDENGGYKLNGNILRYGSLMLHQIATSLSNDDKQIGGMALANLSSDSEGLEHLINIIYGNMPNLYATDNATFENLVHYFRISDALKEKKDLIKTTYNTIISNIAEDVKKSVNGNHGDEIAQSIANSLYIINTAGPSNVYQKYEASKQKIDNLIEAFKNELNNENKNNEKLTNIREDVHSYFSGIDFANLPDNSENSYKESIISLFGSDESKAKNEYYSYILSWYSTKDALASTALGMNLYSPQAIEDVCKMTVALLKLAVSGILAYAMEADKDDKENSELDNNVKAQIAKVKTFCSDINLGDKEILNNKDNEEKPEYVELSNQYKELRDKVKNQLITKYQEVSKDSTYRIKGISNESKSLFEAELKQDNTNNNEDWFTQLISKGVLFDNPENIKTALNDVKVLSSDGKSEEGKETFGDLDDKDKNTILMNLIQTIDEVNKDSSISKLIDEILKKWGIDADKEKENADIEAELTKKLPIVKNYAEQIKEVKDKLSESNTYDEVKKEYDTYRSEVIKQLSDSYKTNAKDSKYKIKALYKNDIKTLIEDEQKVESLEKLNWFDGLIQSFLSFKSIDNIRTAFANVSILEIKDDKEQPYKFSDKAINESIQNKILFDLCNAFENVMNDGKLPEMLATMQKQLGLEKQENNYENLLKGELGKSGNLIKNAKEFAKNIMMVDYEFKEFADKDEDLKKLYDQLFILRNQTNNEFIPIYKGFLEERKAIYCFNIENKNFYYDFYNKITVFSDKKIIIKDNINALGELPIKLIKEDTNGKKVNKLEDVDYNTRCGILYDFLKAREIADKKGNGEKLKKLLNTIITKGQEIINNQDNEKQQNASTNNSNESVLFYNERHYKVYANALYEIKNVENANENANEDSTPKNLVIY